MSIFQFIILIPTLILFFKEFGGPLITLVKNAMDKKPVVTAQEIKPLEPIATVGYSTPTLKLDDSEPLSLSIIVGKWEELRTMCRKYNLDEAEEKLDEVFPLLLDDDKETQ